MSYIIFLHNCSTSPQLSRPSLPVDTQASHSLALQLWGLNLSIFNQDVIQKMFPQNTTITVMLYLHHTHTHTHTHTHSNKTTTTTTTNTETQQEEKIRRQKRHKIPPCFACPSVCWWLPGYRRKRLARCPPCSDRAAASRQQCPPPTRGLRPRAHSPRNLADTHRDSCKLLLDFLAYT